MRRGRPALVLAVVLVLCAGTVRAAAGARSSAPTPQEITVTVSDGTPLACELVLPDGPPPADGWPGLLLFAGFGLSPAAWQKAEIDTFAPAGFASLSCDARGTGGSGGKFDFDGPNDVQDARDLFDWFAARPDISDAEIGAFGIGLGGGEVWNAAVAGVPFKAIVPGLTWTSLAGALTPNGVVKTNLLDFVTNHYPLSSWDPALAQAGADLSHGQATAAVGHALAERSSRGQLHSLAVPTLLVQERHDLWFDIDQVSTAYKLLAGPRHLYIGPPTRALPEVLAWFEEYLTGGPALGGGVELAHAPWDGAATLFKKVPPARAVFVNLPGTKTTASGVVRRSVRLPGGPLETFGDGSISVRYSGASPAWTQLVAQVTVKGTVEPVTQGAAPITSASGVVTIPLLDTSVLLPRGKRLTVRLGPTIPEGVFNGTPPPPEQRTITIRRVTLKLSVLKRPVSR